MGRMGEISIWLRNKDCSVAKDVSGVVSLRTCCGEEMPKQKIENGHAQLSVPPGCYVVEGETKRGKLPPIMVIVKCDEAVCLNPVLT